MIWNRISYTYIFIFSLLVVCIVLIPYAQREQERWESLPLEGKISYWKEQYKHWCCKDGAVPVCRADGSSACNDRLFRIFIEDASAKAKVFVATNCKVGRFDGYLSDITVCDVDTIDNLFR